jgi:hypothetical protein
MLKICTQIAVEDVLAKIFNFNFSRSSRVPIFSSSRLQKRFTMNDKDVGVVTDYLSMVTNRAHDTHDHTERRSSNEGATAEINRHIPCGRQQSRGG